MLRANTPYTLRLVYDFYDPRPAEAEAEACERIARVHLRIAADNRRAGANSRRVRLMSYLQPAPAR
jgi:hypothetical protein